MFVSKGNEHHGDSEYTSAVMGGIEAQYFKLGIKHFEEM
jgi:hypothetical protein